MAKVGGDNEKVGRVCQVLAEQLPIFKFLILTQGTYKHGDDAKFVFVAAKKHTMELPVWAQEEHLIEQWRLMEIPIHSLLTEGPFGRNIV